MLPSEGSRLVATVKIIHRTQHNPAAAVQPSASTQLPEDARVTSQRSKAPTTESEDTGLIGVWSIMQGYTVSFLIFATRQRTRGGSLRNHMCKKLPVWLGVCGASCKLANIFVIIATQLGWITTQSPLYVGSNVSLRWSTTQLMVASASEILQPSDFARIYGERCSEYGAGDTKLRLEAREHELPAQDRTETASSTCSPSSHTQ